MSVGLVLVTHDDVGDALLAAAVSALGMSPLEVKTLSVKRSDTPEDMIAAARLLVKDVAQGDGVIIMTDIYGSTPSNIATALYEEGAVGLVAGVNLPMLIKVFNYPRLPLHDMVQKAIEGGREGILSYNAS